MHNKIKKHNNIITMTDIDDNYRVEIKFRRLNTEFKRDTVLKFKSNSGETIVVKVLGCDLSNRKIVAKKFKPCIYVWTTHSLSLTNTYKVGLVNWQTVSKRLQQTDTTGVLEPIELVETFDLNITDPNLTEVIESEIHRRVGKVRKNREAVRGDWKSVIRPTILAVISKHTSLLKKVSNSPIPRYFQHDAAMISTEYYKKYDRGWIQWTCGSGKSFGSYWIFQTIRKLNIFKKNLVVILVPNRHLVKQTHDDWVFVSTSEGEKVNTLKVGDVDGSTNDSGRIARWINHCTSDNINLIVSTYQSFNKISIALKMIKEKIDFLISDEVHRLAGSVDKSWAKCLLDTEMPSIKRLSMTASPIEYTPDSIGYSGMENESLFGKRFHKYLFLDAQFDGYITPLEIMGIDANPTIIRSVKRLIEKNKNIVQKNLYNESIVDVSHIEEDIDIALGNPSFFVQLHNTLSALKDGTFTHPIIYTNSIKRIKMFMACLMAMSSDYGVKIDYTDIFTSKDNIDDRINKLNNDFAKSKIAVVGNVYCLQEGISINEVDGIVMIDPRSSGPSIIQIIGRPVRIDRNNPDKVAKIILPIILEKDENGKIQINKSHFSTTRDWMISVCGSDEDFAKFLIKDISFFSPKSLEGIEVRTVLPSSTPKSISGKNISLDKAEFKPETLDFNDIKEQLNIDSLLSTKSTTNSLMDTDDGKSEKLNRQASNYVIELKFKLQKSINTHNIKSISHYTKLIKSKDEYISDFSQIMDIDNSYSGNLLSQYNIDEVVSLSNTLKEMNIKSIFKSMGK